MKFELNLLDKIVNRGLLGKRIIGRPTKYNIINKHGRGVLEMMYKPRNQFEAFIGKTIHGFLPVLSYFTYRFHVERARVAGMRVEDTYHQKFFREPYITSHIFAQNFHPSTLNERIRNVHFYRKVKTLYKGFKVPDWAQSQKNVSHDLDAYSRQAWDNAMKDFNSEWTPMPYAGDRLEPNAINWFRIEQMGKGFSSRLFFNETPQPSWHRHGGYLDEKDKTLYSFKYADQEHEDVLGFDVSTKEGREALDAEVQRWKTMTPEIYESMGIEEGEDTYNNNKYISTEPHFQRALNHYRQYLIEQSIKKAIKEGNLSQEDVDASRHYFDEKGLPSASLISMGQKGLLGVNDDGYNALQKVLEAIGLDDIEFDPMTAEPVEEQLIRFIDAEFDVKESDLTKVLPIIIADPRERAKIEALLESGDAKNALPQEESRHLA